jgi:catechol 2,3-dioxygenase-like lactoylglutathione lyase family enzyme
MSHLELVALAVRDDAAIRFFVDVLRFELAEDTPSLTTDGRTKRCVVIRPDGGQTGILLARADGDQRTSIVEQQFSGRVGMFLRVDDFDTAYQRMVAAGVRFVSAPRDEAYGRREGGQIFYSNRPRFEGTTTVATGSEPCGIRASSRPTNSQPD